jgi:hypothetical protein
MPSVVQLDAVVRAPFAQRLLGHFLCEAFGYTYFADGDVLCAKITPCFENGTISSFRGHRSFIAVEPGIHLDPASLFQRKMD